MGKEYYQTPDDYKQQVERGIELLKLCQRLQSEKDGVDRPEPFLVDKSKTLDEFAEDIGVAIANMATLYKLLPMMLELSELGQKLESEGKIRMGLGDDYSTAALKFVRSEHGLA